MTGPPHRVRFSGELRGRVLETVEGEELSEHPAEGNTSDTVLTPVE